MPIIDVLFFILMFLALGEAIAILLLSMRMDQKAAYYGRQVESLKAQNTNLRSRLLFYRGQGTEIK